MTWARQGPLKISYISMWGSWNRPTMTWNVQRGEGCSSLISLKYSLDLFLVTQIHYFISLKRKKKKTHGLKKWCLILCTVQLYSWSSPPSAGSVTLHQEKLVGKPKMLHAHVRTEQYKKAQSKLGQCTGFDTTSWVTCICDPCSSKPLWSKKLVFYIVPFKLNRPKESPVPCITA